MNLDSAMKSYIATKVEWGFSFAEGRRTLAAFQRRVGNIGLDDIREIDIRSFLDNPPVSAYTRSIKYFYLFRFFQHCYARSYMSAIKMPENRVAVRPRFAPHIYTRLDIRKLLKAIPAMQERKEIDSKTFRTLLLFLYGTGATPTEALALRHEDVDWKKQSVAIFTRRLGGYRRLPIGGELCSILHEHSNRPSVGHRGSAFFHYENGEAVKHVTLNKNFAELRRAAGVLKTNGAAHPPRVIDFRHTFAVHRIEAWLRRRADLNGLLPSLSVYLGFVGLSTAERYLRCVPERFNSQLNLILPERKHPKWKKNAALMRFLDEL